MHDFSDLLLAVDFDRTMTSQTGEIPKANLDAVEAFIAQGGAFTIATGRSKPMFEIPATWLRVNAPVIIANGAALWDVGTGETAVLEPFLPGALEAAWTLHERFPALRMEYEGLHGHDCFGNDKLRDDYLRRYGLTPRFPERGDLLPDVLSVTYYAPFRRPGHLPFAALDPDEERPFDELEAAVRREFSEFFEPLRSMPRMIELIPKGCGKGKTARALASRLGRARLYCAGDAPNDLDLLEAAGRAFVPADGSPALLERGFERVCPCGDGSIAAIFETIVREA